MRPLFMTSEESELSGLFFIFCLLSFYRIFVASSLCIFLTTGKTRDVPHYFLISPSFPFWKTSLILYYRIWISELRVCSSKYQNPSFFQGDSFLTILRRNTFPLLVPTETIRKYFLIVSKSKFQKSFLAPLPLTAHQSFSVC